MATLTIDQISKSFGSIQALNKITFECQDGEFLVIVGPSGAGKTTTLNCIAGIEYPESGSIFIDGKDVTMTDPKDRDVAMVFETYALYPQYSVYDNLAFPLKSPLHALPKDEIEQRVRQVAQVLSIDMLLNRLPRQLSQGQRQRVSLGRALVRQPKLYLFDEPISHLDAKLRNAMRRELKLMRSNLGQTTIYVTHDYLEALSLADRVVVLIKGEVLQYDQVRNVYNHPAAVEVGQLFGELPMIFFNGTINDDLDFRDESEKFSVKTGESSDHLVCGQSVILALRPTDLQLVPFENGELKGEVYSVQYQFGSKLVTVSAYDHLIDVVAPANLSIESGDKAGVQVRPEVCFFFDQETHRSI